MSQIQKTEADRKFIETCLELELLQETDAQSLSDVIGRDGNMIAQTALQRGLLGPVEIEIVHSLQNPMEIVSGYKILNLVGRGAMGVVYRALQLDLERIVALKIILTSSVSEPNVAARFEREAKALARLQHPNIVQALNFGKQDGRYYFAMEYVSGRTCEQAVRDQGVLAGRDCWSIARQVASGLLHASRQNLIHRDIKPANLILVPPPDGSSEDTEIVKIADFGLAMFADQSSEQLKLTTGDKVMGSPAYMSPEQFGGRPVDLRSDIYSLGATLWHLLFGKPPHQGGSIAALYQQKSERLVYDPTKLPTSLPNDQVSLLLGLLDPNPERRPNSYDQLIDAIDALDINGPTLENSFRSPPISELAPGVSISDHPTLVRDSPDVDHGSSGATAPDQTMTQTVTLPSSSGRPWPQWIKLGAFFGIVVLGLVAAGALLYPAPKRGARESTRVIGNTPLFDGVTLSGWDVGGSMVGAWNTIEAPDASTAIACTSRQGALTRRIPPVANPRISLFVWLQPGGGTVDVDFAYAPSNPSDVRGCLRLTSDSIQLGSKSSDFATVDASVTSNVIQTVQDRFLVVDIERQPDDWYVFVEQQFLGSIPIDEIGEGDSIRLVVHGTGPTGEFSVNAYFADVQLYELGPKTNNGI